MRPTRTRLSRPQVRLSRVRPACQWACVVVGGGPAPSAVGVSRSDRPLSKALGLYRLRVGGLVQIVTVSCVWIGIPG